MVILASKVIYWEKRMELEINIMLLLLLFIGIAAYLISVIFIYEFHKKRNDKTPAFLKFNFRILKYTNRYKMITKGENRSTGFLFYLWVVSLNLTLFSAVLLLVINIFIMKGA